MPARKSATRRGPAGKAAAPRKKTATTKTARKSPGRKGAKKRAAPKNSLVSNINRRKKAGKSRPKSAGTVSKQAYAEMEAGWPTSPKKRGGPRAPRKPGKKGARSPAKKAAR